MLAMNVLLFNSPTVLPDFDFIARLPNLGIVSIAGNLDCDVHVADLHAARNWRRFVVRSMKKYSPDVVGISAMSFQIGDALEVATLAKERGAMVVMGGYHPTMLPDHVMSHEQVDMLVRGEGEATFSELIQKLESGEGVKDIAGISYRSDGRVIHNPDRPILDLCDIELPDRGARLIKRKFYVYTKNTDVVETSRGCTYKCKFCSISKMYGRTFRKYSIERVIADIQSARDYGAKGIAFSDDNITLDTERLVDLCGAIVEAGLDDMHFYTQASSNGIARSPKISEAMAEAGFKSVFIGIENVIERDLDFFSKNAKPSDSEQAVRYLRDNDIIVSGGIVLGAPDDTREDLWTNFKLAKEMGVDVPIFYVSTPYPSTVLREELLEEGLVENVDDYNKYDGLTANVRTHSLTAREIQYETWKMYERYFDFNWARSTLIRKHYPGWILKSALKLYPKYFVRRILKSLHIKGEEAFFEDDVRRRVYSKGGL